MNLLCQTSCDQNDNSQMQMDKNIGGMAYREVVLLGFGSANQELAKLILARPDLPIQISGIFTRTHGLIRAKDFSSRSIDLRDALANTEDLSKVSASDLKKVSTDKKSYTDDILSHLKALKSIHRLDVVAEGIIANYSDGEPAVTFARFCLKQGIHYCTANKAPVALFYDELDELAKKNDCKFRFESACGDGIPIFNLKRHCLLGAKVTKFEGILNTTTNLVLDLMEKEGKKVELGILAAQGLGIAEADPSGDVDGFDAAVKCLCLAKVLMGFKNKKMSIADIPKDSLNDVSLAEIESLKKENKRLKFICKGEIVNNNDLKLSVKKTVVDATSPFYHVNRLDNIWRFEFDNLCPLTLIQHDGATRDTGYGLFTDLLDVIDHHF